MSFLLSNHIDFVILMSLTLKKSPDKGLEPLTTRLRVLRSTNWASRAATFERKNSHKKNKLHIHNHPTLS